MKIKIEKLNQQELVLYVEKDKKRVASLHLVNLEMLCCLEVDKHYSDLGIQLIEHAKKLMFNNIQAIVLPQYVNDYKQCGFVIDKEMDESFVMSYHHFIEERFHTYEDVHEFISSQKTRVYSLDNFRRFMNDLANPQQVLSVIHIGGTNGKGSTTNYIRSVLQNAGYKVATFTSPVLVTRLEIMRINDIHISSEEILKYANRYMDMWLEYELSMFEIEVFIAIMYFIKHQVDYAVFEVGLGGELDATNIVYPLIALNTNIGLDHTEYLGHTYASIAKAKAGIIKDGVDYITGETNQECLDVFKEVCFQHHSQLLQVDKIQHIKKINGGLSYDYRGYHIELNTPARYQCRNSALAIETLLYLRNRSLVEFKDEDLLKGMKEAKWAGRFEVVNEHPLMIIDGAHNKEGIDAFFESAKQYSNIKVIFSALKDKDTDAMLEKLLELTEDVTVCEFDFYRSQKAKQLAKDYPVNVIEDWHQAIEEAYLHKGTVFITGSLYFIAEVRAYLLEKKKEM